MTRSNTGGGGGATGAGGGYTLPLAADGVRGGVQVGFTTSAANRNYAVQLDNEKMFVNVPWTDHYAWADITGKPSSFTPSAHTHAWSDITSGVPAYCTRWPSWSEVTSKPTSKTAWGQTYLDSSSNFASISGDMSSVGNISFAASGKNIGGLLYFNTTNSRLGVGNSSPSYKLDVSGVIYSNTGVYSAGYVTALSDARKKRVLGDIVLSAEQIAKMPAVRFEWKNNENPGIVIGTLAQNWREILPEAVHTLGDGTLSFDYQSAAIVALINLADEIAAIKNKMKRYGFK
jgi:hypothetical protein